MGIRCRKDHQGHVIVEVNDSGAGIDAQVLPRLFNAFEQGGVGTTRQFGGLGLGLTICKGLVELHDGSIEAQSDGAGKGASFQVRLPLHKSDAASGHNGEDHVPASGSEVAAPPVGPLRIMLVEDHRDTAKIMKRLLTRNGHEVQIAGDVVTALELAGTRTFDLFIGDMGLPDGNGVELMLELRKRGITMPGIALSGYGQEDDVRRTKEAGFAIHLTKPTSPARLAKAIATVAGRKAPP